MLEQKGWRSNGDRENEESGSSRGRRNLIYVWLRRTSSEEELFKRLTSSERAKSGSRKERERRGRVEKGRPDREGGWAIENKRSGVHGVRQGDFNRFRRFAPRTSSGARNILRSMRREEGTKERERGGGWKARGISLSFYFLHRVVYHSRRKLDSPVWLKIGDGI